MEKAAEYFEKAADLGFELAQVIANYLKYIAWI
jgi:TPR repeat protein